MLKNILTQKKKIIQLSKFRFQKAYYFSSRKVYDPYRLLGVERTDEFGAIKKQYFKLVKKYHPDRNPEKDTEDQFKQIQECFERIKEDRGMKVRMSFRDDNDENVDDDFESVRPDQSDYK